MVKTGGRVSQTLPLTDDKLPVLPMLSSDSELGEPGGSGKAKSAASDRKSDPVQQSSAPAAESGTILLAAKLAVTFMTAEVAQLPCWFFRLSMAENCRAAMSTMLL